MFSVFRLSGLCDRREDRKGRLLLEVYFHVSAPDSQSLWLLGGPSGPALVFHASGTFIMAAAFLLGVADVRVLSWGSVNKVGHTVCCWIVSVSMKRRRQVCC